jgi:hypothetical protein
MKSSKKTKKEKTNLIILATTAISHLRMGFGSRRNPIHKIKLTKNGLQ